MDAIVALAGAGATWAAFRALVEPARIVLSAGGCNVTRYGDVAARLAAPIVGYASRAKVIRLTGDFEVALKERRHAHRWAARSARTGSHAGPGALQLGRRLLQSRSSAGDEISSRLSRKASPAMTATTWDYQVSGFEGRGERAAAREAHISYLPPPALGNSRTGETARDSRDDHAVVAVIEWRERFWASDVRAVWRRTPQLDNSGRETFSLIAAEIVSPWRAAALLSATVMRSCVGCVVAGPPAEVATPSAAGDGSASTVDPPTAASGAAVAEGTTVASLSGCSESETSPSAEELYRGDSATCRSSHPSLETTTLNEAKAISTPRQRAGGVHVSALSLDRGCATICNSSTSTVDLEGWGLRSSTGLRTIFKFPPLFDLKPGEAVTVWSGAGADQYHDPPRHLFWTRRRVWSARGAVAVLLDPDGNIANSFEQAADPKEPKSRCDNHLKG